MTLVHLLWVLFPLLIVARMMGVTLISVAIFLFFTLVFTVIAASVLALSLFLRYLLDIIRDRWW